MYITSRSRQLVAAVAVLIARGSSLPIASLAGKPHSNGDVRLAAYIDKTKCGPGKSRQNNDWCVATATVGSSGRAMCRPWVVVDSAICSTQKASLVSLKGDGTEWSYSSNGCDFAFYAQYECTATEGPTFGAEKESIEWLELKNKLTIPTANSGSIKRPMYDFLTGKTDKDPLINEGALGPRWIDNSDIVPRPDNWQKQPERVLAPTWFGAVAAAPDLSKATPAPPSVELVDYLDGDVGAATSPMVEQLLQGLRANGATQPLASRLHRSGS